MQTRWQLQINEDAPMLKSVAVSLEMPRDLLFGSRQDLYSDRLSKTGQSATWTSFANNFILKHKNLLGSWMLHAFQCVHLFCARSCGSGCSVGITSQLVEGMQC